MMEIGIDLANGKDFTVDNLTRHKWPEEKPATDGEYLARLDTGDEVVHKVLYIADQYTPWTNYVTHWWELPEVTE